MSNKVVEAFRDLQNEDALNAGWHTFYDKEKPARVFRKSKKTGRTQVLVRFETFPTFDELAIALQKEKMTVSQCQLLFNVLMVQTSNFTYSLHGTQK